jgi:ArsR family metal-binding transcriptional regulator
VAFHAHEIDISDIESREWAEQAITELVELVNNTWERRDELTASYETPRPLTPMAVYQELPQTNCGLCGEATCFNFALKLATSQKTLRDCPPLFEPQYAENVSALQNALEAAGATG